MSLQIADTAQRLPPEVIGRILNFLARPLHDEDGMLTFEDPVQLKAYKRMLGSCIRVCRYWRLVLRPCLFATMILKSEDDLKQLHLITSLARPLTTRIHSMQVWELGSVPWHHHLFIHPPEGAQDLKIYRYMGKGQSPADHVAGPPRFSRFLPAVVSRLRKIESLYIQNHYFSSFQELVRVVNHLPRLRVLVLHNTCWRDIRTQQAAVRCSSRGLQHVSGIDSFDNWDIISLALASPDPRRQNRPIDNAVLPTRPFVDPTSSDAITRVYRHFLRFCIDLPSWIGIASWCEVEESCVSTLTFVCKTMLTYSLCRAIICASGHRIERSSLRTHASLIDGHIQHGASQRSELTALRAVCRVDLPDIRQAELYLRDR